MININQIACQSPGFIQVQHYFLDRRDQQEGFGISLGFAGKFKDILYQLIQPQYVIVDYLQQTARLSVLRDVLIEQGRSIGDRRQRIPYFMRNACSETPHRRKF